MARADQAPAAQRAGKAKAGNAVKAQKNSSNGSGSGKTGRRAGHTQSNEAQADPALFEGQHSVELLKALHILTREGKLNQDSRRKLKQVQHLVQFIAPLIRALPDGGARATLADHGAGKSYLGFVLYDQFYRELPTGQIFGIETRPELVTHSQALAQRLHFERMQFLAMRVDEATSDPRLPAQIDVVTALHACDTATDDAIAFGLAKKARAMVLVPCCQAEVARVLNAGKALALSRTPLAELWRHPLHTRELGSQITNVMRCLYLEAMGYKVTVTELVGWEHSMKNELILAEYTGQKKRSAAERLRNLLAEFGLQSLEATRYAGLDAVLAPRSSAAASADE